LIILADLVGWWGVGLAYGAVLEDSKCWPMIFAKDGKSKGLPITELNRSLRCPYFREGGDRNDGIFDLAEFLMDLANLIPSIIGILIW
jgi:hypothetical protein